MKLFLLLYASIICLTTFSCVPEVPETDVTLLLDQTIMIDGIERFYHIQTPKDPSNKPVVVMLHGHGGSANQSIGEESSKAPQKVWLDLAEAEEIILIVPNGELGPEDSRGWNDCRNDAQGNPETDDVLFISELLAEKQTELDYDVNRVYLAGVSNGASMSIRLVQEIPEKIAAFASVITTMPVNSECLESDIPISALFMNGTGDNIAPYDGGQIAGNRGLVHSTDESIDYWIARNNTDTEPIEFTFEDIDETDKSTVEKYVYPNGTNGTEVVLYKVNGGGHTEPSLIERYSNLYLILVGEQNGDIEMAHELWNFFKNKSK